MGFSLILMALAGFSQYQLLEKMSDGEAYTQQEISSNDAQFATISIIYLCLYVTSVVFFIMWFRRAYFNLHQVTSNTMLYTEGWAAGAWFVPLLNLVRPYQIMVENWTETHRLTDNENHTNKTLIDFWWAAFLVGGIYARVADRLGDSETISGLMTMSKHAIISSLMLLPSLLLAIIIIKRLSQAEERLHAKYNPTDFASPTANGL